MMLNVTYYWFYCKFLSLEFNLNLLLYSSILCLVSGWEKTSSSLLGFLSSKTNSEYHLDPKAVNKSKIGKMSSPFSVKLHNTITWSFLTSVHFMIPSLSNSFRRMDNTLGVSPGIDSNILLNLLIFRKPMSLIINMVHFLPKTPRLVLIGQLTIFTWGLIIHSSPSLPFFSDSFGYLNYVFTPPLGPILYFVYLRLFE